jgi:hypothetical protein
MPALDHSPVSVRSKLSALWASTVFCYLYGDYFELYVPGKLEGMLDGRIGPLGPATQGVLVGTSLLLAVPSLMVCLSMLLAPAWSRGLNIVFGLFYALVMALAIRGSWNFYFMFGLIEIALSLTVVWMAWKWPRADALGVPG